MLSCGNSATVTRAGLTARPLAFIFFSRRNLYAFCLSYHSNTEKFCLKSFVRLGYHNG